MDTYIVIFETQTKEPQFREYLRGMRVWGRITENVYAIKSDKTAVQVRDDLSSLKATGDRIMVVKSGYIAAWDNARIDAEWLKKNL